MILEDITDIGIWGCSICRFHMNSWRRSSHSSCHYAASPLFGSGTRVRNHEEIMEHCWKDVTLSFGSWPSNWFTSSTLNQGSSIRLKMWDSKRSRLSNPVYCSTKFNSMVTIGQIEEKGTMEFMLSSSEVQKPKLNRNASFSCYLVSVSRSFLPCEQ